LDEAPSGRAPAESVRLELERCQRELDDCHKRLGELEQAEALLAGERVILEMVARESCIVLFNHGAEKVFGYAQEEVIGKSLDLLLPQRFAQAHRGHIEEFSGSAAVSRSMGQRREVFGRRKNGGEFPAEASISKLDLGGELVFTVILRDITERKRAAEAWRTSEHLARGQLEALTRTLAALSQESEPEKLLEHVLEMIGRQLEAHSVGVYETNANTGRVQPVADSEEGRLHLATPAEIQTSPQLGLTTQDHPIWTEFFRTGGSATRRPASSLTNRFQESPCFLRMPSCCGSPSRAPFRRFGRRFGSRPCKNGISGRSAPGHAED